MAKSNRIDTAALFSGMIGKGTITETTDAQADKKEKEKKSAIVPELPGVEKTAENSRKTGEDKKVQVSVYLTSKQAKELRLQDAEREKEKDKSAIVRTGLDIVLTLNNEEYIALKTAAQQHDTTPGKIVKEALIAYGVCGK